MTIRRQISAEEVLPLDDYAQVRDQRRRDLIAMKRDRRMAVGPLATFYFENYETMLQQVQEMVWIEKGGKVQIADELAAYNPLIPQGDDLVVTLMFEIDDEVRRQRILAELGGVEETVSIDVDGSHVKAVPEVGDQVERTTAGGKTSSIHFLHFRFTPAQIDSFRNPQTRVIVQIGHSNYQHMAAMPDPVRLALVKDFA